MDNISSVAEKQQSQLETYYQSTKFQKVQPSATLNHQLETREPTQDAQAHTPPLLDTLKMELKLESDFLLAQERPFLDSAELQLASLQAVEEIKSQL